MYRAVNPLVMEIVILISLPLCLASDLVRPIATEYQTVSRKASGCNFGYLHYDIGDSWHPDIAPFGVMFCVTCTCNKISNQAISGKVACRNIRHRCPTTSCANPKITMGHCCPSCPDEFISLLTIPDASTSRQNGVARAHFTLVNKLLHVSIHYEGARKLRLASFTDQQGSSMADINIQRRAINGTQVCLTWNHLSDKQIESLKKGNVSLELRFKRQQTAGLRGEVSLHNSYSEESFETVMSSDDKKSNALLSFNLAKSGKLLKIFLRYKGSHSDGPETKVTIKIVRNPTDNKGVRTVKIIRPPQVKKEKTDFKATWLNPTEHALKWLARGHLNVTVILGTANQTTQLSGRIKTKRTCNTIVSQLSGRDAPSPTMTGASGFASLEFDDNGQIHYQIFLSGLVHDVLDISIQATNRRQTVKRLSRLIIPDVHGQAKVTGVWERPSFTETCWLFSGNMYINVRTTANTVGEIHGQIKQFPYRGHHLSYHDPPVLLSGNEVVPSIQTGAAGQVWFSLDKTCALHYHLLLSGMNRGRNNLVTAELQGFADYGEVPQPYDEHVHTLRSFEGETASGSARDLDPQFLVKLVQGLVYLQVSSEEVPQGELRSQVKVDGALCSRRFPHLQQAPYLAGSCKVANSRYFSGESWHPDNEKCSLCTCQDSEITCFPVTCQRLNCTEAPVLLPHLCCPVCPVIEERAVIYYEKKNRPSIQGCYVKRDRKVYPAGAVWHPYIQPFGYMKCMACTCLGKSEEILCQKVTCPKLQCKYPTKARMSDCCMRCPDHQEEQSDEAKTNTRTGKACNFRGSKFDDGHTWQPYFPLFGPSRCITCKCENGLTKCSRAPCPEGQCRNSIDGASKTCCVPCAGS